MNDAASAAKSLRSALKAQLGVNARQVSVRSTDSTTSAHLSVVIKDPAFSLSAVEAIANAYEDISRDESGDILGGGNTFVDVSYDGLLVRAARKMYDIDAKLELCKTTVFMQGFGGDIAAMYLSPIRDQFMIAFPGGEKRPCTLSYAADTVAILVLDRLGQRAAELANRSVPANDVKEAA